MEKQKGDKRQHERKIMDEFMRLYEEYRGSRPMYMTKESEYYGDDGGFDLDWVMAQDDEFQVIGNIFDNPDLLPASSTDTD